MVIATSGSRDSAVQKSQLEDILILNFDHNDDGLRTRVYDLTQEFLANQLKDEQKYLFNDNQALLSHIQAKKVTTVITTNNISLETSVLLKGLGIVQVLIGMREDLLDVADIIVDPLIRRSEQYLVGTRYLLTSVLNEVKVAELASILGISENALKEEVKNNEAETELFGIVQLYQRLAWDSEFFNMNIGYISCLRLTPNIERHINKFIRRERIDLLEYLCNCHDRTSVQIAEKNGYSFVDIRLTFQQSLSSKRSTKEREGCTVRKARTSDIEEVKQIATDTYKLSRYYFDENFDREKVVTFYINWAEKAVRGEFDDFAYVLERDGKAIGFCTIKKQRKSAAAIGLFGLNQDYRGEGLAQYLLEASLSKMYNEEGIDYVEVVTQGRNYEAQRLYQRCGFITKKTELWYHKWLH